MLQCVAVCCSAWQCVAGCCSVLQCVAVYYSVLQRVAVYCGVLQRTATHTPANTATHTPFQSICPVPVQSLQHTTTHLHTWSAPLMPCPESPYKKKEGEGGGEGGGVKIRINILRPHRLECPKHWRCGRIYIRDSTNEINLRTASSWPRVSM